MGSVLGNIVGCDVGALGSIVGCEVGLLVGCQIRENLYIPAIITIKIQISKNIIEILYMRKEYRNNKSIDDYILILPFL